MLSREGTWCRAASSACVIMAGRRWVAMEREASWERMRGSQSMSSSMISAVLRFRSTTLYF